MPNLEQSLPRTVGSAVIEKAIVKIEVERLMLKC